MNAPELALSAKAKRWTPGVNVPVAEPSCALEWTSAASCWRLRPRVAGNWERRGVSAAGSSSTAGGWTPAAVLLALAVVVVVVAAALEVLEALGECDDEPQAASASAHRAEPMAGRRRGRRVMLCLSVMQFGVLRIRAGESG
jgi:hypothetical protein